MVSATSNAYDVDWIVLDTHRASSRYCANKNIRVHQTVSVTCATNLANIVFTFSYSVGSLKHLGGIQCKSMPHGRRSHNHPKEKTGRTIVEIPTCRSSTLSNETCWPKRAIGRCNIWLENYLNVEGANKHLLRVQSRGGKQVVNSISLITRVLAIFSSRERGMSSSCSGTINWNQRSWDSSVAAGPTMQNAYSKNTNLCVTSVP